MTAYVLPAFLRELLRIQLRRGIHDDDELIDMFAEDEALRIGSNRLFQNILHRKTDQLYFRYWQGGRALCKKSISATSTQKSRLFIVMA